MFEGSSDHPRSRTIIIVRCYWHAFHIRLNNILCQLNIGMKISEILFEGRDAPLYHTMKYTKAMDVFEKDLMEARWYHQIHSKGNTYGNSFTRNKKLLWPGNIVLTINQRKLAQHNKIIPLDGDYAHYLTHFNGRGYNKNFSDRHTRHITLSEEFVIGPIQKLHRCISSIHLHDDNNILSPSNLLELYKMTRSYSKTWKIPLTVARDVLVQNIETLRRWREEEDETNAS
jgi:hypothetical protein